MGLFSKVAGFLAGGTVKSIAGVADEYIHTEEERFTSDQADLADARAMQMATHESWFDSMIDGFARLIRPGMTTWICGGFIGWWELPKPDSVDPFWQSVFWVILTFWFGGRVIMKDIPKMVAVLRGIR